MVPVFPATFYQDEWFLGQLQNAMSQESRNFLISVAKKRGGYHDISCHCYGNSRHSLLNNLRRNLSAGAGCFQFFSPTFPP
jgi:hypothetical protein